MLGFIQSLECSTSHDAVGEVKKTSSKKEGNGDKNMSLDVNHWKLIRDGFLRVCTCFSKNPRRECQRCEKFTPTSLYSIKCT